MTASYTIGPPDDALNGLQPIVPRALAGVMPNAPHQRFSGFMGGASYELAIVEFDDQGLCYNRQQMDGVAERLETLAPGDGQGQDVVLVVFVHGWKHDARTDDEDLSAFRILLSETVERERATSAPGGRRRPVLGIFVGWRGLSAFGLGDAVADATFCDRQGAGRRIATGSARELFGRLRHYRRRRQKDGGTPLLVIAGHSFGGMIVYSALAQSLIEAASAPVGRMVPTLADLVLLINPAIEGVRYLPIHELIRSPEFQRRATQQLPVFICAQAENDQPVGVWFPIGNITHNLQSTIGSLERQSLTRAIGFVRSFRTHTLTGPQGGNPFVLDPPGSMQSNPFWVVGASKEVIDGHGGIWRDPFLSFIAGLVFQHVQASKKEGAAEATIPEERGGSSPDLAAFAKSIGPIRLPGT